MAAAVLNGTTHHPTAHLQIKYVSRLPDTRTTSSFLSGLRTHTRQISQTSPISATIVEGNTTDFWRVNTVLRNVTSNPQSQAIKIYAWPMFAPEDSQFIASASTQSPVAAGQNGRIDVEVSKRDLAVFDERKGKWILEEGIYMFEIKPVDDVMAGLGIVKQVSVVGKMSWDY